MFICDCVIILKHEGEEPITIGFNYYLERKYHLEDDLKQYILPSVYQYSVPYSISEVSQTFLDYPGSKIIDDIPFGVVYVYELIFNADMSKVSMTPIIIPYMSHDPNDRKEWVSKDEKTEIMNFSDIRNETLTYIAKYQQLIAVLLSASYDLHRSIYENDIKPHKAGFVSSVDEITQNLKQLIKN